MLHLALNSAICQTTAGDCVYTFSCFQDTRPGDSHTQQPGMSVRWPAGPTAAWHWRIVVWQCY